MWKISPRAVFLCASWLEQQPSEWAAWLFSQQGAELRWHLISAASPVVVGSSWRSTDTSHNSSHRLLTLLACLDGSCSCPAERLPWYFVRWKGHLLLPWFCVNRAYLLVHVFVFNSLLWVYTPHRIPVSGCMSMREKQRHRYQRGL